MCEVSRSYGETQTGRQGGDGISIGDQQRGRWDDSGVDGGMDGGGDARARSMLGDAPAQMGARARVDCESCLICPGWFVGP